MWELLLAVRTAHRWDPQNWSFDVRISKQAAVIGATMTLGLAGPAIVASAATAAPGHPHAKTVGHVYVNDNTATTNTVTAFNRHADGTLTREAGSPFATGGAGLGAGTASQGSLEVTPNGQFLLAVDAGSNQISVLRIEANGSLEPTAQGPVSSGGLKPVSLAVTEFGPSDLVYVANAGDGGENYTGFTLGRGGNLHAIKGSTVTVPDGSQLGDVLFDPTGTHLAGTRVGTGYVDSFSVGRNGLIYPAADSPYPSQGPGPIGAEFSPTAPNHLFVSNAHGGADAGTVSAFNDSRSGQLTSIGDGPFADNQTAPCWVEITHDGRYLFTTNTAVPSISRYAIARDGSLTLLGTTPLDATKEKGPVDLRLSPNGQALYVVDSGAAALSTFSVHGGNLTALTSSPTALPAGSSPVGVVVD
jgi:6-phosphogluconolactonase